MAGLTAMNYMRRFDRVNLCPQVMPSTIPSGPGSLGRAAAMMLAGSLLRGRRVVFLGQNVAECFSVPETYHAERYRQLCVWYNLPESSPKAYRGVAGFFVGQPLPFHWAVLPHPSDPNLWYNDAANLARAKAFMLELAEG